MAVFALRPALCAVLLCVAVIAGAAPAGPPEQPGIHFKDVLGDKPSGTPAEQKIDSNLLFAMRALASGGSIAIPDFVRAFINTNVAPDQTTFVVIRATVSDPLLDFVRALGGRSLSAFAQYDTLTAEVPIGMLVAIAERADVRSIGPREVYETHRYVPTAEEREKRLRDLHAAIAKSGIVSWQGVPAHQANRAINTGITGAGTKVCVLSDGINSLAARQATGDLPGGITVLSGQAGSGDEGTAMLEIINDMAPGAALGFATAVTGAAQFATNIQNLRNVAGCHIIVDDISYLGAAAFQDDVVARAVATVSAAGALYLSSAGNSGSATHGTSGTFEGDFVPSAAPVPPAIATVEGAPVVLHSFGALPYAILTKQTPYISLKWSDPLGASTNDYDLVVMNSTGTSIIGGSFSAQTGTQNPLEFAECSSCVFPVNSRIYVVKYSGATRAIRLDTHRGQINNGTTGSTFGHNAATNALTIGAVDVRGVAGASFTGGAANPVTTYSSDGPRKLFFNASGAALTPGNILFATAGGTTLAKVDLAASDCGATTTPGFEVFCGTSAAAPTVAAIAALVRSAKPSANRLEIALAMLNSTLDIEAVGLDRDSGTGIVMAPGAVRGVLAPLAVTKTFNPPTIPAGGVSTLTISVTNPNAVALQGMAFTNFYPSLVANTAIPTFGFSGAGCVATPAALSSGIAFAVTGGTIPAGGTCSYTVNVTSNTAGSYLDNGGAITTPISLDTAGASATLTVSAPAGASMNVALASAGGLASASSSFGAGFPVSAVNNNERAGANWGAGGGWADGTADAYPDWVQINFSGAKTIDRVVVYTLQDNYLSPVEPTDGLTFTAYGIVNFTVEGWNGSAWVTLGTVSGNNRVKRTVTFAAFSTDRIRVNVTGAAASLARITEIEAWTPSPGSATAPANVALGSSGAAASASSVFSSDFPVAAVVNGERTGANWGAGGGWADATIGAYPDFLEIAFSGTYSVDRVVVYTLQDNYASPVEPTDALTFTQYGIVDFTVQGWNGSSWVTLATVTGNNLVKRTVTFTAFNTDRIRISVTNALASLSRITEVEAWGLPVSNVALASSGAVASASSVFSSGFPVAAVVNGDRTGANWGAGGGWADGTIGAGPDWVQVDFNGMKKIDRVVVYTLQDLYASPVEPTDGLVFTQYGIVDFTVQGWNGSSWVTLGTVSGNNLVKRTVSFAAFTTDRVRVNVTNALASLSRITEIEAWGTPVSNVALASAGAVASATSTLSSAFPVAAVNDGERAGAHWTAGGGWADGTVGTYPDSVQVLFSGTKKIDRVAVYTVQDNYLSPIEPSDTTTFSLYGIVDFTVEGWDGVSWFTLATVSGNNLVKRTATFPEFTTDRIRVTVTNALASLSRITEIEAWGN
jgi:hypothetical protein